MSGRIVDIISFCRSVLSSLKVSIRHFWVSSEITEFPERKTQIPLHSKGRLLVNWEDCTGCFLCLDACPTDCIYIDTIPAGSGEDLGITSDGQLKTIWVLEFDIDMSKCLLCQLCIYPCPTQCISMTAEFDYAVSNRENLIFHFTPFTPEEAGKKRRELIAGITNNGYGG